MTLKISTKVHSVIDYVASAAFIVIPWAAGFSIYHGALWSMMIVGVLGIVYSLVTRYEGGVVGLISMRTHLGFDVVAGIFLIASPWLFNFAKDIYWPHLLSGAIILVITFLSDSHAQHTTKEKLYPG